MLVKHKLNNVVAEVEENLGEALINSGQFEKYVKRGRPPKTSETEEK